MALQISRNQTHNLFSRGCTVSARIAGHHLIQNGRYANPVFAKTFSSSSGGQSSHKNRAWEYLCAGIIVGIGSKKAYVFYTKPDTNSGKPPQPVSSISSGTYEAAYYNPIPDHIVQKMMGKSYKVNCPIPMTDLAYVKVTHYDMKGQLCSGELVVHKKIAGIVMDIFKDIHAAKFPIAKMRLIDEYDADDDRSMEDNNSSAFCFRSITNKPGVVSNHGLGIAIDINTHLNPYVKGDHVSPSNARKYVDRALNEAGMIKPDDAVVKAFKQRGFEWGGDWKSLKDYQHFEIDRKKLGIVV